LLQELETNNKKDITVIGKVKDVAATNKVRDVVAADTLKNVIAYNVTINVKNVLTANSVKDVILFKKMSEEPLPLELAGNIKELVALFKSTLLILFNLSRITYFLLFTRAFDVP
jgi:hypothetical protein